MRHLESTQMFIADPHGAWLKNTAQYQMHDPMSNTVFVPDTLTKATLTDWVKGQPMIKVQPDPLQPPKIDTKHLPVKK